jgi:hypothetical protein
MSGHRRSEAADYIGAGEQRVTLADKDMTGEIGRRVLSGSRRRLLFFVFRKCYCPFPDSLLREAAAETTAEFHPPTYCRRRSRPKGEKLKLMPSFARRGD